MVKETPQYLQMSLASAMALDFRGGRFYRNARCHCINLLVTYTKGCLANCTYCGLAKRRIGKPTEKSFIRVEWPIYETSEIIENIKERVVKVKRICISMITINRTQDIIDLTRQIKSQVDIPLSLLISPTVTKKSDLVIFKEVGADNIGIAVDCATKDLFEQHRGKHARGPHKWKVYWQRITEAVQIFGEKNVGVHLMVGLGETEKEMVETIQRAHNLGAETHLFSFFPEAGSALGDASPPSIVQYRRIQLARYLINENKADAPKFLYDSSERIKSFGLDSDKLTMVIDSGEPFRTSGCRGKDGQVACNRPYANSLPGPTIRNYPFPLNANDVKRVKEQLWSY